ncbi:MAG: hypothetical protein HY238_17350, partial [Acidobacteria bacterium]|nr:hypothetical protein [Acidobacteriota bacterium]
MKLEPGNRKVLDAWAVMAWIKDEEPAASRVQALVEAAEARGLELLISMVNLGEVYYL